MEKFLVSVWQDILGIDGISVQDNFFDLGGHSLLSMKVVLRVEKEIGHRLNPRDLILLPLEHLAIMCEQKGFISHETQQNKIGQGFLQKPKRVFS